MVVVVHGSSASAHAGTKRGRTSSADGTLLFDGTFRASSCAVGTCSGTGRKWRSIWGACYGVVSSTEVLFDVTDACNPGHDGHYRTDLCTSVGCQRNRRAGEYYRAGRGTCTSIPVSFPDGLVTIPHNTWFNFAEAKSNVDDNPGWGMDVTEQRGRNTFTIAFAAYNHGIIAWSSGPIHTGWHTLSICTNNANDRSGKVYGIWLDGARQRFNGSRHPKARSIGGFPIIYDGARSWPLDINTYTGGAPIPAVVLHGAPLITRAGPSTLPPEPPGGWNSP